VNQRAPRKKIGGDVKGPLDYKDVDTLMKFLGPQGQIVSRRRTGFQTQRQRELKKAIKRGRHLGLLPFVG